MVNVSVVVIPAVTSPRLNVAADAVTVDATRRVPINMMSFKFIWRGIIHIFVENKKHLDIAPKKQKAAPRKARLMCKTTLLAVGGVV